MSMSLLILMSSNDSSLQIKLSNNFVSDNSSQEIERLKSEEYNIDVQIKEEQNKIKYSVQRIGALIEQKSIIKKKIYELEGKEVRKVARDLFEDLKGLGVLENKNGYYYDCIDSELKQENIKQLFNPYHLLESKGESINITTEEKVENLKAQIREEISTLPTSRKQRVLSGVLELVKQEAEKKPKEEDNGIHQNEPPESMQGPSQFSEAIGITAGWFEDAAKRFRKIQQEVTVYKPSNDEERARDWNEYINGEIIGRIMDPIFMEETRAEADRKWSTSVPHWVGIIKNKVIQSKHGAGKMAENFLCDEYGHILYDKKGHPLNRGDTRERVGDAELPILETAIRLIGANQGLYQLHDWVEEDQGGHRRLRKDMLHEYFSEAATGSIKSGNPDYAEFMKNYKKKMKEKYVTSI